MGKELPDQSVWPLTAEHALIPLLPPGCLACQYGHHHNRARGAASSGCSFVSSLSPRRVNTRRPAHLTYWATTASISASSDAARAADTSSTSSADVAPAAANRLVLTALVGVG